MAEIRVAFVNPDEFSKVPPHVPDANPRIHHPVKYRSVKEESAPEVREEEALVADETELTNDTVLELDTPTPIE